MLATPTPRAARPAAAASARPSPAAPHCRRRPLINTAASAADVDATTATAALAFSALLPVIAVPLAKAFLRPRKCSTCLGSTTLTCLACRGRGKRGFVLPGVGGGASTPPSLPRCDACEGRGRVGCQACDATGLANAWLWKPTDDPDAWGARGE